MSGDSSFLKDIRLITFDVFGTLVDWKAQVESLFRGRFSEFLRVSESLQRCADPVLPYEMLLKSVAKTMGQGLGKDELERFARGFGKAPAFADVSAIGSLKQLCQVGAISNSDPIHQCDVQAQLGISWDICLTVSDLNGYKPESDAWERAFLTVSRHAMIKPHQWLHVSAYPDYDLKPAKDHGIKTAFIPRPGGDAAAAAMAAEAVGVDYYCSDLFQLAEDLRLNKQGPVRYQVTATCLDSKTADRFIHWIQREHAAELLSITGCIECRVLKISDSAVYCEYVFSTQRLLDDYLNGRATEMRARGRAKFAENEVAFSRQITQLVFQQGHRRAQDFAWS